MSPAYSPAPAFTVRPYRPADAEALARLFYKTVHAVCARDYTPAQLAAAWPATVRTHALLTARPFFAARGYRLVRAQQVERRGVWLTNFVMSLLQA